MLLSSHFSDLNLQLARGYNYHLPGQDIVCSWSWGQGDIYC